MRASPLVGRLALSPRDVEVARLGRCRHPSPLEHSVRGGDFVADFTPARARVLVESSASVTAARLAAGLPLLSFEAAGPRRRVFFAGSDTTAAIVTCGGLCPGINDVIRVLVLELHYRYGCRRIFGVRYGYRGFAPAAVPGPLLLTPELVAEIHRNGGSFLGTSRGPLEVATVVDTLARLGVDLLFAIGGDGTLRGARVIQDEAKRRGLQVAVVGVPKTIDNDILFTERSFGFDTAFSAAVEAIAAAHVEATGVPNGVGLVKLMGRASGFVAAAATLANNDVNLTLVPEVPFRLDGDSGVLAHVRARLERRGHMVIVVAEGAGQDLLSPSGRSDSSGNVKFADVGQLLRSAIELDCARAGLEVNLKYIDPSYLIRAIPANPADAVFCLQVGQAAVHAAMAGRTGLVIGLWGGRLVHVPLALATSGNKVIDPDGDLWRNVVEATGQPARFGRAPRQRASTNAGKVVSTHDGLASRVVSALPGALPER